MFSASKKNYTPKELAEAIFSLAANSEGIAQSFTLCNFIPQRKKQEVEWHILSLHLFSCDFNCFVKYGDTPLKKQILDHFYNNISGYFLDEPNSNKIISVIHHEINAYGESIRGKEIEQISIAIGRTFSELVNEPTEAAALKMAGSGIFITFSKPLLNFLNRISLIESTNIEINDKSILNKADNNSEKINKLIDEVFDIDKNMTSVKSNEKTNELINYNEKHDKISKNIFALKNNPWFSIWVKPRKTIREIIVINPKYKVMEIAMISGFGLALDKASLFELGNKFSVTTIILLCLVAGIFIGPIILFAESQFLKLTGKLLGGVASLEQLRTAISWSYIPSLFAMILLIPLIIIFRGRYFTNIELNNNREIMIMSGFGIIYFIIILWTFFIFLISISEVQKFSIWKAFFNIVLSFFMVFFVLALLVFNLKGF